MAQTMTGAMGMAVDADDRGVNIGSPIMNTLS